MLDGVEEVKGWPVKKVSWISFGVSLVSAHTGTIPTRRAPAATPAIRARIVYPPRGCFRGIIRQVTGECGRSWPVNIAASRRSQKVIRSRSVTAIETWSSGARPDAKIDAVAVAIAVL